LIITLLKYQTRNQTHFIDTGENPIIILTLLYYCEAKIKFVIVLVENTSL